MNVTQGARARSRSERGENPRGERRIERTAERTGEFDVVTPRSNDRAIQVERPFEWFNRDWTHRLFINEPVPPGRRRSEDTYVV